MIQKRLVSWLMLGSFVGLTGCSVLYSPKPLGSFGAAELAHTTNYTRDLDNLPAPKLVLPVAVYGFKDQSGQYKPQPDSSFSTAVSQGGTAMLVKALKDSGWFAAVERENLQDILTERKIVRAIEQPGDKPGEDMKVKLPTLVGAGMIIEGSIIGYDENVKSGGAGVKWLGLSVSDQYRADQVTVNLRAVDIGSGLVMESVTTSKTVYSAQLDTGEYRYVNYQSLLEVELGTSLNEPGQIALQEAIEAAVVNLIVEGIADRKWSLKNEADKDSPMMKKYRQAQADHVQRFASNGKKLEPVVEAAAAPAPAVTPPSNAVAPSSVNGTLPAASMPATTPAPVDAAAPVTSVGTPPRVESVTPWSATAEDSAATPARNPAPMSPRPSNAGSADKLAPAAGSPAAGSPAAGSPASGSPAPAATSGDASAMHTPGQGGGGWQQLLKLPSLGQRL